MPLRLWQKEQTWFSLQPGPRHDSCSILRRLKKGETNAGALPDVLVEAARNDPTLSVHEFAAEYILRVAGENRGAVAADAPPGSSEMSTYRAIVDDKGIIRHSKSVKLEEGTHILVALANENALIAPMRSSAQTALSEERLREELQEDEAWAHLLKYAQS